MSDKIFEIRKAQIEDAQLLFDFILSLAEYEKLTHEVTADKAQIEKTIFSENSSTHAIIGYENDTPVAIAIYFYNYSTFKGKNGLYLEDVFVLPDHRGKGYGKRMLQELASIANEKNCGRFEWAVLNWNTPAINFYESLGAKPMSEWTVYRLEENGIKKLANQ